MPSAVAVAALVTVAVAVQVWWSRRWADTAAEGAAGRRDGPGPSPGLLGPDSLFLHRFVDAWRTHAPWVLGLSVVLVITGATGRRV